MLKEISRRCLSPFITAVLLILAFPNPQISILAWIAFIPLFFIIDSSSRKISFLLSYLSGLFFFAGLLYWLTYVTKPGYFVLIFYCALYFGFFGLLANVFLNKLRTSRLSLLSFLILPSLWVSLEFVRGFLFTGFPWGLLGYTQYKNPLLIQIADITGSYGVSFLIMMINFAIYVCLSDLFKRKHDYRALKFQAGTSIIILAAVILYGYFELNKDDIKTDIRLSVVQGNIEQFKKWDPYFKNYIMDRYETLTKESAKDRGDLIIWPETAVPGFLDEKDINLWLKKVLRDINIPLFAGAAIYEYGEEGDRYYNSAVLFLPDGSIDEKYDKIHLVPLGEYVPYEKQFPFVRNFIDKPIGEYTPGEEYTVFDISKEGVNIRYAALICFEDIFPDLVRRFVRGPSSRLSAGLGINLRTRKFVDFAINITNDAWFGKSSEHLQHTQASVFRAVENRISVARAANTGFSCYINPKGIIEDSIYDKNTGSMYVPGFKTFDLKVSKKNTFYTRFGDLFIYLCLLLILGTVSFDILRTLSRLHARSAELS